jgi:hypothetical protein
VGLTTTLVVLAATGVVTAAGVFLGRWLLQGQFALASGKDDVVPAAKQQLFRGWEKPDLVLLLTGQQHGYMLPCGCSEPQKGGLERRYNFLQTLKARGWQVAALDLGDVAQLSGPQRLPNVQGLIKYKYSMEALKLMDYSALGHGDHDAALPLKEALDNFALNNPKPSVLMANLKDKDANFPDEVKDLEMIEAIPGTNLKVGVLGVVGNSVAERIKDPQVQFEPLRLSLPKQVTAAKAKKPDLLVLLYQGTELEAKKLAQTFPDFQVILCLSDADVGGGQPQRVVNTQIVTVGHKGKEVGVLGIFRTGKPAQPYLLRYQLVEMDPEYKTPAGQEDKQPILRLMERYTKELKERDYLHQYAQSNHPHQIAMPMTEPTYVGSERCKKCHEHAYEVWEKSGHAHAYPTLVDVKHPSLRQYDGECVVCHVTGFGYKGGFTDEAATPKLKNVGCESCHGPASEHVKRPTDTQWQALLNPWKAPPDETPPARANRLLRIDKACQECHDSDNDVHWDYAKKWPKIAHPTP